MACPQNHSLWDGNFCRTCDEPWGCDVEFCTCACERCTCSCYRVVCPNCNHTFVDNR